MFCINMMVLTTLFQAREIGNSQGLLPFNGDLASMEHSSTTLSFKREI